MNDLKAHVDFIFSKYKESIQIKELKYEVLSNLEAKVADLIGSGMEYSEAVNKAKESIDSIDHLIDENIQIYINKYKLEYMQIILLYSIIVWIITIPAEFIGLGFILNKILFICSITIGIWYFRENRKVDAEYSKSKSFINMQTVIRMRKVAWIIWIFYMVVSALVTTAIKFGSNIWFSRAISVTGPYQFAEVIISYMVPFLSMIIPLIFNVAPKLILKYEVGENNENKE